MKLNLNRRQILKYGSLQLALPLLGSIMPEEVRADPTPRKHFIGGYFPNGAHMPHGDNGNWNFSEALAPLGEFQNNTAIFRGMHNGFAGIDPHWQNCAGFLSCHPIQLGDPGVARCAKSLDQYIADALPSPLHSLEIGGLYYHVHPLNDHPGYSNDYLNRISWQAADKYRSPVADPARLFEQLFTTDDYASAAELEFIRQRKMSVLDHAFGDAQSLSARLPSEYRPVLESYMETVRELEQQLESPTHGCSNAPEPPVGDFGSPNSNYMERFRLMHQMVVLAMQCGLTNVATIMYSPAVADGVNLEEELGPGGGLHGYAHHGGSASNIDRLRAINVVQTRLLTDLLSRLKEANLLTDTIVLYGSDMSDGDIHHTENLPVLLCGEGTDLRLGGEIGTREDRRPLSDLHMDVLRLMGITDIGSFGTGECLSTGRPTGVVA